MLTAKNKLLAGETAYDVGQELLDVQPILKDVEPAVCGDVLPTHMFTRLARQEVRYNMLDFHFRGFHEVLNAYRGNGRSFKENHIGHYFKSWRPTEKQLDWVMNPGDPNQINRDEDCIMYQRRGAHASGHTIGISGAKSG
jgi:hypothetical protein